MPKALFTFCFIAVAALSFACSATSALYQPAEEQLVPGNADDYPAYLAATRQHLESYLVALPGFSRQQQVDWNMPFRTSLPAGCSGTSTHGILLVHGLSDSPFVFRDFAKVLAKDCIEVRTVLLQGHGTRPGDMILADADVWREQVREHFNALAEDVDVPLIGGFSLGGALATELALSCNGPQPAGLAVIAPAWELNGLKNYLWLASTADLFVDFVEQEPELNPVKYESLAINSAVQLKVAHRIGLKKFQVFCVRKTPACALIFGCVRGGAFYRLPGLEVAYGVVASCACVGKQAGVNRSFACKGPAGCHE